MVIHNFHFVRARFPAEADPPLIVDADAVLSGATAFQRFQPVARRHPQVLQLRCRVQLQQLPAGGSLDVSWQPSRHRALEYLLRLRTCEVFNHLATERNATR